MTPPNALGSACRSVNDVSRQLFFLFRERSLVVLVEVLQTIGCSYHLAMNHRKARHETHSYSVCRAHAYLGVVERGVRLGPRAPAAAAAASKARDGSAARQDEKDELPKKRSEVG